MAPTPSSAKSNQTQFAVIRTTQTKQKLNFNSKTLNQGQTPPEHPVEVIGQIRDYPNRKEKPPSILQVNPDNETVRVRVDVGYRDFKLDGVSFSKEKCIKSFYKRFIEERIKGVKVGNKCTIMMYGPTGAGKSHTMFGCGGKKELGIVYRSLRDILGGGDGGVAFVQVTVLEVYNEKIYDLLSTNCSNNLGIGCPKRGSTKVQVDCHLSEKSKLKRATMADSSAPLLTHLEDEEEETSPPLNFDKVFEQSLSDFNLSQFLQVILVGLSLTFDAQQIFITVFTDAYPTWHCLDHTVCTPATTDICKLPRSAWDWDGGFKGKSVISEFDLECSSSFLRGLPTSAFYMGSIVGGVFMAMIPDGFLGRKRLLFFTTLAMSLTGISIFFSTNIWSYAFLKFAIGFARSQTGTYAFNLIGEIVSTKWRPRATMIPFTLFVLGFMSLSGIAFLVRHASWRFIYLCTSVPAAIHSVFIYFFALESPRWLHVQGNNKEAFEVLKTISPRKRGYLESVSSRLPSKETLEQSPSSSIMDLFIRRWAFRRIIVVMIIMFGLGMMYYGVPLAVRDIKVNIYLSEALNAMVELPTFVITPILLEKFNRRSSVLVNCLVGGALGVFCFVLTLSGRTSLAFVFELGSFFCARIGFNLMAVYMIEMFPTCVRNFATTMLRQALVVGGACCPIIASVGRNVPSISFAVFGFVVSGLGFFALLLPETKGSSLCDTMDEQEQSDQALKTSHVCC